MFAPREIERARFEEIEDNPELKEELGLTNATSYVKYFDDNYEHVGCVTVQNWVNKRKKDGKRNGGHVDKEFNDFLELCMKEGAKNSRYADLYAQLKGWKQKPKEEVNGGFTPAELIGIGQQVRQALINEYRQSGGRCPLSNVCQVFHVSRLGQGREQPEEDEVAAVGLPAGLTGHSL